MLKTAAAIGPSGRTATATATDTCGVIIPVTHVECGVAQGVAPQQHDASRAGQSVHEREAGCL
eukprot:scaffold26577_cov53-Phaeocystis_antarctica.AAC.2